MYHLKHLTTIAVLLGSCMITNAQINDSIQAHQLNAITLKGYRVTFSEVKPLDNIHQTYLVSGKKSEVIAVQDLPANLTEKTGRQIFAKIPGAFIYDMDGSGNQVNIATRGLDPHRSWEYYVSHNGIMTNSDIYGYPASHFSAPMESIKKIEMIRGTGSMQYGSQFGGMVNYVTKTPDTTKSISYEGLQSVGSFGLLGSYNAISGKTGKLSYYAYYQRRVSDGYRDNATSTSEAQMIQLNYAFSPRLNARAELARSQYAFRIPGPLTDAMFEANPRQATRTRNYFSPDIYVPSLTFDWKLSNATALKWTSSAILGTRSSVQVIGFADTRDTINAATLQYNPRQVDIDHFNSYTSELRLQQNWTVGRLHQVLVSGVRYINNDLHRQQLGKGTTGTDMDFSITTPDFGRDIHLKTQNIAIFAENLTRITPQLDVSVGVRFESGASKMSGKIIYLSAENVPLQINRQFPILGISSEYRINESNKVYGGWSQAYRPVIFADIIPANNLERTNPDIKDAFGYNAELGIKGKLFERLTYDLNAFQMLYRNRIGSQVLTDDNGQSYIWRTNIGDSKTNGIELYADYAIHQSNTAKVSVFTATSWFDGAYISGTIRNGNENADLTGNRLETVPEWISRNGFQVAYRNFAMILQYSYVADSYSDPLNTVQPSANGARGIVPAYQLWDLNFSCKISQHYTWRFSFNNLTNEQYFTKRPTGYPGQGVWPSDGRSIVTSLGIRF